VYTNDADRRMFMVLKGVPFVAISNKERNGGDFFKMKEMWT